MTTLVRMLMYGKEASNRKQEIDRQHHTIPNQSNQRPKDKHYGKAMESWITLFTAHGKAKVQLSHVLQTELPTIP